MTHFQNIIGGGGGGGVSKRNMVIVTLKLQLMMANYEIVQFIAIMQHLIENFTSFF